LSSDEEQYLNKNNINHFCKRFHHIHIITKNNISIELHHRVTRTNDFINCPISKSFFDDFQSIDYFHEKINIPSTENTIIHSLCHFSINSSFKKLLRTLIDIKNLSLNHKICWEDIILKYDNAKIRKSIALSLELIDLNKGNILGLDETKAEFKKYFPKEELVLLAQQKLYDISSIHPAQNLLDRLKGFKHLKTIPGVILPSRRTLKYRYKTPNPGPSSYVKYYNEQLPKTLFFLQRPKKGKNYLGQNKDLNNWLDKDA